MNRILSQNLYIHTYLYIQYILFEKILLSVSLPYMTLFFKLFVYETIHNLNYSYLWINLSNIWVLITDKSINDVFSITFERTEKIYLVDLAAGSIFSFRFWCDYRKTFTMRDSQESFSTDAACAPAKTALRWPRCTSGGQGFILKAVKSVLFAIRSILSCPRCAEKRAVLRAFDFDRLTPSPGRPAWVHRSFIIG